MCTLLLTHQRLAYSPKLAMAIALALAAVVLTLMSKTRVLGVINACPNDRPHSR